VAGYTHFISIFSSVPPLYMPSNLAPPPSPQLETSVFSNPRHSSKTSISYSAAIKVPIRGESAKRKNRVCDNVLPDPLSREDGSIVYNCCWASPAQSFSGPRPAGLMTTFYCLRYETPPTWRATSPYLYPPGTEWPSYTPRHWFPSSSPPTTRRATVEVFDPASTRYVLCSYIGRTKF
jgi:hypothetical protein